MNKIKKQTKKVSTPKKVQEPIGTRIAKAVFGAKKISERIFGYISYDIKFVRAVYHGKTQRPAKITALEKGIVGILLVDETASFEKIGSILGLDVVNDKAEQSILRSAIETLRGFNAIEGDDSLIALTEGGHAYADKGERPDTYTKDFDIFVDTSHPSWYNIKNGIGDNVKKIEEINTPCDDLNLELDQIKAYAEQQAQDVHFPQNRYLLESATWNEGHEASYKVYVCFVQNVANSEDVRAFVYDENTEGLNSLIADQINQDEDLKSELLNSCIRLECENDEETTVLEGDAVEVAKAEITEELKQAEQKMIKEEEEVKSSEEVEDDVEDTTSNTSSATKAKAPKISAKDRLHKKALYDSLSFEVELQTIFTEDDPDEIWLISPWIKGINEKHKHSVFIEERGPAIERFLNDESKRVFVAYSAPSVDRHGKVKVDENGNPILNIDSDVKEQIEALEEQHQNFFFVELPEFHEKNVFEIKGNQTILFSGSFNVLSFSVSEGQTHVRREEMTLAHHLAAKKKYDSFLFEFAEIYANKLKKQIDSLEPSEIINYKNERLEYFLSIENAEIHKLFSPIEDVLEEKNIIVVQSQALKSLTTIGQQLVAVSNMGGLNAKDKKKLGTELASVEKTIAEFSIDDPSTLERLNTTKELFEKIPLKKIFPGKSKAPSQKQSPVRQPVSSSNTSGFSIDNKVLGIVNGEDPTDEKETLLLLLSLCYASSRRLIKKGELQKKIKHIVMDMPDMYSCLAVESSMNNEDTTDLTIVVSNHSVKFRNLYLGATRSQYEQRVKTVNDGKRQTWVAPKNVESILANLLK